MLHQGVGIQSVLRKAGDPYGSGQLDRMVAHFKRMGELMDDAGAQSFRLCP
ncbi:hypothetical protein D3C87_2104030 [compost metagenome]